jgi:hypothetical protein
MTMVMFRPAFTIPPFALLAFNILQYVHNNDRDWNH